MIKSPEADCYICKSNFEYGLDGNPQTWSGIEYKKSCEVCERPVCYEETCSVIIRHNTLEKVCKVCIHCRKKITDEEFEKIKDNDYSAISEIQEKYFPKPKPEEKPMTLAEKLTDPVLGNCITAIVVIFAITAFGLYKLLMLLFG